MTPLLYQRHSRWSLELHESSNWRATAPDTHRSLSDTKLCAYKLQARTSLYIWCETRMTAKLTYLMTAYYTPNDGFTANDASFYNNNIGRLTYTIPVAMSFQSCRLIFLPYTYCFTSLLPKSQNKEH